MWLPASAIPARIARDDWSRHLVARLGASILAATALVAAPHALAAIARWTDAACLFRGLTGLPCPGCGITTSLLALARGDAQASWSANPAGFGGRRVAGRTGGGGDRGDAARRFEPRRPAVAGVAGPDGDRRAAGGLGRPPHVDAVIDGRTSGCCYVSKVRIPDLAGRFPGVGHHRGDLLLPGRTAGAARRPQADPVRQLRHRLAGLRRLRPVRGRLAKEIPCASDN